MKRPLLPRQVSTALLALALSSTLTAGPARAQEVTAPGGGGVLDFLGDLLGRFPFFNSLLQGANVALEELEALFPFLDGLATGPLGLPDLEDLDARIDAREPTVDDILLGPGSTLDTGHIVEMLRARTRAISGQGTARSILSEEGQIAAAEILMGITQNEANIAARAEEIGEIADLGQDVDTSFERLGFILEQRRAAALQEQDRAAIDAQLMATLHQNAVLTATQLELDTHLLDSQAADRAIAQRRESGTSSLLQTSRSSPLPFGGTGDE